MATLTITPIKTFVSGETVLPATLNQLAQSTVALTAGTIVDADVSASAAIAASKLSTAAQQALLPAGAIMPFAMNSAPAGWLAANGNEYAKTGDYAALFAAISTTYGETNGSGGAGTSHFRVPDLRGIFVRGSGSQTISGTTYDKTFAAKEGDAIRNITGTFKIQNAAPGTFTEAFESDGSASQFGGSNSNPSNYNIVGFDASNVVPTATENRPANIAMLYCIKF
jgi:hypothetical protein